MDSSKPMKIGMPNRRRAANGVYNHGRFVGRKEKSEDRQDFSNNNCLNTR